MKVDGCKWNLKLASEKQANAGEYILITTLTENNYADVVNSAANKIAGPFLN